MRCSVCGKQARYHKPALWSIFKRNGKRWEQANGLALQKCDAIRVFQSMLLAGGYELRRVKGSKETYIDD